MFNVPPNPCRIFGWLTDPGVVQIHKETPGVGDAFVQGCTLVFPDHGNEVDRGFFPRAREDLRCEGACAALGGHEPCNVQPRQWRDRR
ncbi:unnamed protein product [Ectocarpus fasciculatus]